MLITISYEAALDLNFKNFVVTYVFYFNLMVKMKV